MGKTMKSEIIERIRKRSPLETKLKVSNEMAFIDLIVELGYREDKAWTDEEDELLSKLMSLANKHTEDQMKIIDDHKIT